MHLNSVLIPCFLFAFMGLAGWSQKLDLPERSSDSSRLHGGAVWQNQTEGTFNRVHGIFIVPEVLNTDAPEAFATVEIIFDDSSCPSGAMFRLGVNLHVIQDGPTYRQALYQWYPGPVQKLDIPAGINTGDTIQLEFISRSTSVGQMIVNNLDTHQSINKTVNSTYPLCGRTAGWVVRNEKNDRGWTSLAKFGKVTFKQANTGIEGSPFWGPFGATLVQYVGSERIMGSVMSYNDGSVEIAYLSDGPQ